MSEETTKPRAAYRHPISRHTVRCSDEEFAERYEPKGYEEVPDSRHEGPIAAPATSDSGSGGS